MIFDSHAHYDDKKFSEDRESLLSSMKDNGIAYIVNIGSNLKTTRQSVELSKEYDFIYATVGVHPSEVNELNNDNFEKIVDSSKEDKVVAIGETGLDYYWKNASKENQKIWFERHGDLARESDLPLVVHSRDAAKDTLDMMKGMKAGDIGGVVHCFSYGVEMAREYLNMGFYLGIGGVITFDNAKKLKEVVSYMPLDMILLETDAPYLSPAPNRGKRNSSLNLKYIINEIAEIKGESYEKVIEATCKNAMKMYKIKEQ